jgi:MFS transporter, DHA1 family, tetracycline resistance protein
VPADTVHLKASRSTADSVRRPLVLILFTIFLDVLGLGLIIPVAPFYARAFGAEALQVGLLFTAFAVMQFLTTPILGALSDRFGRRPVLVFSLLGETGGYVLLAVANSLPLLFLARIITGATSGNIGAAQAYLADISTPQARTRTFGLLGATFGLGFMFGPALGGVLSGLDMRAPALAAAGLVALNAVFVALCLPESLAADRRSHLPLRGQINPLGVLTRLVSRPSLRVPLVATFLVNFAFVGFQTNFAVYVGDRFGFGPLDVGTLFLALGLTSVVMQGLVLRRLSARYSDRTILVAGILVSAVGYVLIGSVPSALMLWAALPVLAAGSSLWRAPLSSLISKLVGLREQGQASGGSQAMSSLASIVGPLAAGLAYERVGQATPYVLAALVMALTALLVVRGQTRRSTATASAVLASLPAPLAERSA